MYHLLKQTDIKTGMNELMDGKMDGLMDERQMDRLMDGQMDFGCMKDGWLMADWVSGCIDG